MATAYTPAGMRSDAAQALVDLIGDQLKCGSPQGVIQGPFDPTVKAAVVAAYQAQGWVVDDGIDYISVEYPA